MGGWKQKAGEFHQNPERLRIRGSEHFWRQRCKMGLKIRGLVESLHKEHLDFQIPPPPHFLWHPPSHPTPNSGKRQEMFLEKTRDSMGFPISSAGKESTYNAGDLGSIPGLGRSPGEGRGYPLQYSSPENSLDCIVHGVAKSQTWLSNLRFTSNRDSIRM